MQNNIQITNHAVLEVLVQANEDIKDLYGETVEGQAHKLRITTQLDRIIRSLANLEGIAHPINSEQVQFAPITNFMGEELVFDRVKVNPEIANPNLSEVEQFKKNVNDLYISIPGIPYHKIASEYKGNAGMELTLRGVARLANVQNYADAAINEAFYEAILNGIKKNEADELFKEQQEAAFLESTKDQPKEPDIELTDAYLNAFPQLIVKGYKTGDFVKRSVLDEMIDKQPPATATPALQPKEYVSTNVEDNIKVQVKDGQLDSVTLSNPGPIVAKNIPQATDGTGYEGQQPQVVDAGVAEGATIKSVTLSDEETATAKNKKGK